MWKELTPEQLMWLSRMYQHYKDDIKALMLEQLDERKPQKDIAKDFGVERSNIAHMARRNKVYYIKPDRDKEES